MKIGVFDSGVGGLSVVNAIKRAMPGVEILFMNDSEHVPYGTRPAAEIRSFVVPIFQKMVDQGCQVIVVACNTVSTVLGEQLAKEFPVPLILLVPMVKPAAFMTKTGIIAVCATPRTLESQRYAELKKQYAAHISVLEPDCSDWSYLIEHSRMNREKIHQTIQPLIDFGADVIVLGCTHYHWIEQEIREEAAGHAHILQPEFAIVKRLEEVLNTLKSS